MTSSPSDLRITNSLSVPLSELQFSFTRSSGPGGQNVNKVNSQAHLRWDVAANETIPEAVKQRLKLAQARRFTIEGELLISSQRYRDQLRNRQDCLDKLTVMLQAAVTVPKKRRPTKVPRGVKESRLRNKKAKGQLKQSRKRPRLDD
ncbi:MAG: aminoacyl-tRNA hydrolase [Planctomycetaceae bacterium]|nr:aminoacyl-tRNA hydrolase [Planctomycetaceae bacterium]MCB9949436.1 aminoacyl-tRNA hydrolase [Planctomycetaceae bacterium]